MRESKGRPPPVVITISVVVLVVSQVLPTGTSVAHNVAVDVNEPAEAVVTSTVWYTLSESDEVVVVSVLKSVERGVLEHCAMAADQRGPRRASSSRREFSLQQQGV